MNRVSHPSPVRFPVTHGQVLDTLTAAGKDLDDWIILFTSDHGEMLGEHDIWEKQKFFEGSVRVPLFVRWTKGLGGGRTVNKNVNLVIYLPLSAN